MDWNYDYFYGLFGVYKIKMISLIQMGMRESCKIVDVKVNYFV